MTLRYNPRSDGYVHVQMVACPYCDKPLNPQAAFRQHWSNCPHNPEADQ